VVDYSVSLFWFSCLVLAWLGASFVALMAQFVEVGANADRRDELFNRCLRASEVYWQVSDVDVVMPIFESPNAMELRALLQSINLTVFCGLEGVDYDVVGDEPPVSKVVIFHAADWREPGARAKVGAVRAFLPQAVVCVVTGLLPVPDASFYPQRPVFDDARAVLQAAGVGFFSINEVHDGC
jgi:hypothetical protein